MLKKYFNPNEIEAGCDEAGRGCLAGPVFAAAVIWPELLECPGLDDSKKLTSLQRERLKEFIEKHALSWAVAQVDSAEIDRLNILNASILAMHQAIGKLHVRPSSLLIDGNRFKPYKDIPHKCIVMGDSKYVSIAAASILAKTHRDAFMKRISNDFPQYHWKKNKGYPTIAHRRAIREFGPTPHHRISFRLLPESEQGRLF